MRWGAVAVGWLGLLAAPAFAQTQPPSEQFLISAKSAFTWSKSGTDVVQLQGSVRITLDRATMKCDRAVVFLTSRQDGAPGEQNAEFALIGHIELRQEIGTRTGDSLLVKTSIGGEPRITADQRTAQDMSGSALYKEALAMRAGPPTVLVGPPAQRTVPQTLPATTGPATSPAATVPALAVPIHLEAGDTDVVDTEEGTVAIVAWNGVTIFARQGAGEIIEMQCQRAALFTDLASLHDIEKQKKSGQARQHVTAIYLEGDARIQYTSNKPGIGEQRLMADHVYYEFATDRAILLNAVLHTVTPQQVPFIVRAQILRQLGKGEYEAQGVQLTSSAFAVPSYSIAADRLYVHSEPSGNPRYPVATQFEASNNFFEAFNVPFFYLPYVAGTLGQPGALRGIGLGQRSDLGFEGRTLWGLFETFNQAPPQDLDAAYSLDYFSKRGPATGLNATWRGDLLTEPQHQPWSFDGQLKSYLVYDEGIDQSYGRLPVKPDGTGYVPRGWAMFEHEHFFPNDWEAQVRLGYLSDPTFLEEWFPTDFYQDQPKDVSGYLKRQTGSEAFTLLAEAQPNRLITTSDMMANQFEVERLPELGYHRIGDSFDNDALTFFSDNITSGLDFQHTRATLRQQGFAAPTILPGIPSLGLTGSPPSTTWRADFRQEIDWPISTQHFRFVPYVVGRFTEYSNTPEDDQKGRFFGAVGARLTTSFWKIDPTAESDLFDIHQLRHIIEPQVNLFAAGTTVDRSRLFMYDDQVDAINDVSAVDLGIRQRWQTLRGGPGRWRSVDVFTLDIDAEFFSNKPARQFARPFDFRGAFFPSLPETSIPRDSLNADATWRVSDTTVVLADAQYNWNARKLATGAVGVLIRRSDQESWYIGNRYIADLHSNIASIQFNYRLSQKYQISVSQDFDFGLNKNVASSIAVVRTFDRFLIIVSASHNQIGNQNSFSFGLVPLGFNVGVNSSAVQGPFAR